MRNKIFLQHGLLKRYLSVWCSLPDTPHTEKDRRRAPVLSKIKFFPPLRASVFTDARSSRHRRSQTGPCFLARIRIRT